MAVLGAGLALVGALSLGLTTTAGAASGYPGTTTVTTVPGGSTRPSSSPISADPSDPCATNPGACSSAGAHPATGADPANSGGTAGTLAFTGADLLGLIVGALFLLVTGTLLVVFTRRRAIQQPI